MKILKTHKFSLSMTFLLIIFFTAVFSNYLIKNDSVTKPTVEKTKVEDSSSGNVNVEKSNNSANVEVNNKVKSEQTSQSTNGTCKVTRNGVVTIVPANQVNVNEKSSGDINVKVECDSNDIDVKVNTSN